MTQSSLATVRERLRRFAGGEAASSPLYLHLAENAAADDDVAGLLTAADDEYASPTLLLAAAHRLVLAEPVSDLANYYPSVGGDYGVDPVTWRTFRTFVLERAEKMRELIAGHTTQTNEVRRAAQLYPAVALAAKQAGGRIGLLDIGCSAGLLLGMDAYGYRYTTSDDEQLTAGPSKSPLVLECALTEAAGAQRPTVPKKLTIGAKVGLDRAPVDLTDEESYAWQEACIWADQPDRLRRLSLAASLQRRSPPELVAGDIVDDLAAAATRIPGELPLVVLTSHALHYLRTQRRQDLVTVLGWLAAEQPLWWVSKDVYQAGMSYLLPGREDLAYSSADPRETLGLARWRDGEPVACALGRTTSHGERLEWLAG